MANEIIFNLDVDSKNKVSSFAFRNGIGGVFYLRPYSGQYVTNWSKVNKVTIVYIENNNMSNKFTITLDSSNIKNIDGQDLMEVTLPTAMLNHSALYIGTVQVNNQATQTMDMLIYDITSVELDLMRQVTLDYENTFYKYLDSIKKDKVNVANGVAVLDQNKKILESYLPDSYKKHIDTKIRTGEAHKVKLDGNGIMWYFDSDDNTWKKATGQNATSTHTPPTVIVENGKIVIKHHESTVVVLQKYAIGDYPVSYFTSQGFPFNGSTITVTEVDIYTYYYKISNGEQYVIAVEIKETDLPFPAPTITVSNGLATVKHKETTKVKLQKWAQGSLQVSDFETQGTEIINNQFIVADAGIHTVYYELFDGRKFVQTFLVKESDLPKDVMPTWTIVDGVVTLTYAPHMNITVSKWDIGDRTIPYFATNGNIINNNKFEVTTTGQHTIYFKTAKGNEYVLHFNVRSDQIKPDPIVIIKVVKGVVTVQYPSDMFITLSKWDIGIKNILYFRTGGYEFTGNTFTVEEVGKHTLYFKDEKGREYVKVFDVLASDLPPQIKPRYTKQNGKILIAVDNKAIYTMSKYESGIEGKEYFADNGNIVSNWEIPITVKGSYTHYYAVNDGRDGVSVITVTDEDLPHKDPVINISNGLARVFHDQPSGVTVVEQRWIFGNQSIENVKANGEVILDNKFYVTQSGVHTLYYLLSNGGEYIMTFNVLASQLEKPWSPATITIVKGVVTVTYPTGIAPVLQKWDYGNFLVPHFADNGNIFTGNNFTVTQTGTYTLYYKLDNDKEYVQVFTVTENDMKPKFISPTITIVRGVVTVVYNSSMDVTQTKWIFGIYPPEDIDTTGEVVTNNTFNVTQAGDHTLFTQLEGQYAYRTTFTVRPDDLLVPDKPPVIRVIDGNVTIVHDSKTKVALQKWDYGNNSTGYFENNGNVFTGNSFPVDRAGQYTYYYVNTYGDKFVYPFIVKDTDLPYYEPILDVFDGLLTIQFTSPTPPSIAKIDSGIRDKEYFATSGNVIVDGKYPITAAGQYTIYWREENGNDYITIITVTEDQAKVHTPPTISIVNVFTVSVEYATDVKPLVSTKKWAQGNQDVNYFTANGNVETDDVFVVSSNGLHTYYYKYRTRGFVKNFYILIPPDIETKYGVTKVKLVEGALDTDIVTRKWAVGVQTVEYFQTDGNVYTGDKFNVTEADMYTLYMKDITGGEHVFLFTVTQDMIDVPTPTVTIVDGVATVTYDHSESAVTLEKWDIGSRNVDYFVNNGQSVINHSFTVKEVGVHTLYYILENEYKFVKEFIVTEDQLPVVINLPNEIWGMDKRIVFEWDLSDEMPAITLLGAGIKNVEDFQGGTAGGAPLDSVVGFSHTRLLYSAGFIAGQDQTLYVKMANGKEEVRHFVVTAEMLAPPPSPEFSYNNSNKTITLSNIYRNNRITQRKWGQGQQTTLWFNNNGTEFTGNSFTISQNGWITVFVKYMTNTSYVFTYDTTTADSTIETIPLGSVIKIGSSQTEFVVLSDRVVIARNYIAQRAFDSNPNNSEKIWVDIANTTNIGYWLNNTYYNNNLTAEQRNAIEQNTEWEVEMNYPYSEPSKKISATIMLLTSEYIIKDNAKNYINSTCIFPTDKRSWSGSNTIQSKTSNDPRYFTNSGLTLQNASATETLAIFPMFKLKPNTIVKKV